MEITAKRTIAAMAEVHGDKTLMPTGRPVLHQNASPCNVSETTALPKPPSEPSDPLAYELTPQKMKAIALLVSGRSFTQAATELEIDRTTIYRWRREPEFAAELKRRMAEVIDVVTLRMRAAMLESSAIIGRALLAHDRNIWAFKVINSKRVWDLANTMTTLGDD